MLVTCGYFILPTIKLLPVLNVSSAMRVPEKYIYAILPISFCAFTCIIINNIYLQIKNFILDRKKKTGEQKIGRRYK
jgi:TRAP-type C4-dicarboxylate transport system permease small subunit